ncbi:MAG: response regulator transcription factor [Nitrospirota bacterium]
MNKIDRIAIVSNNINKEIFSPIKNILFSYYQSLKEALESSPDILIVDDKDVSKNKNISDNTKILMVGEVTKEKTLQYLDYPGFCGFISPDISSDLMETAIRTVKKGGIWLNRDILSMIFEKFSKVIRKKNYNSDLLNSLSIREREILDLVSKGHSNKNIAKDLFISEKTVKTHLSNIYKKLGVAGRTEAISLLLP